MVCMKFLSSCSPWTGSVDRGMSWERRLCWSVNGSHVMYGWGKSAENQEPTRATFSPDGLLNHSSLFKTCDHHMRTALHRHTGEQQLTYGSGKELMWSWQLAQLITPPLICSCLQGGASSSGAAWKTEAGLHLETDLSSTEFLSKSRDSSWQSRLLWCRLKVSFHFCCSLYKTGYIQFPLQTQTFTETHLNTATFPHRGECHDTFIKGRGRCDKAAHCGGASTALG